MASAAMDVDEEEIDMPTSSSGKGDKKRFEVKKVSAKYIVIINLPMEFNNQHTSIINNISNLQLNA